MTLIQRRTLICHMSQFFAFDTFSIISELNFEFKRFVVLSWLKVIRVEVHVGQGSLQTSVNTRKVRHYLHENGVGGRTREFIEVADVDAFRFCVSCIFYHLWVYE